MTKEECFYLGKVTKSWGVKGQVVLFFDVDDPMEYEDLDMVLVETKHGLMPYFIEALQWNGNKAVTTFEELTPEESASLIGCDLYLPLEMLPKLEGNNFYFHEVKGFRVVDEQHGDIGIIENILEYPAQPLFQVMQNDTEILIPIVDPIIKEVNREKKTIFIEAPNGLIELYLNNDINKC